MFALCLGGSHLFWGTRGCARIPSLWWEWTRNTYILQGAWRTTFFFFQSSCQLPCFPLLAFSGGSSLDYPKSTSIICSDCEQRVSFQKVEKNFPWSLGFRSLCVRALGCVCVCLWICACVSPLVFMFCFFFLLGRVGGGGGKKGKGELLRWQCPTQLQIKSMERYCICGISAYLKSMFFFYFLAVKTFYL